MCSSPEGLKLSEKQMGEGGWEWGRECDVKIFARTYQCFGFTFDME